MTTNEAIKKMQAVKAYMISGNPIWSVTEMGEAFDMAIEALSSTESEEFEWCHDCKEYDQEAHCCHRWTKVIRNTVEELKAEWKGEWIPCSERLPEVGEDVFISVGERVCEAHLRATREYFITHKIKAFVAVRDADAWMPLPEPYKEGDAE